MRMSKSFAVVCLLGLLACTSVSAKGCQQDAIAKHNELRKLHGVDDLSWDQDLAKKAQKSANALAKNRCALKGGLGGNVWGCYGKNCGTCAVATSEWYKGESAYNFDTTKPYTANQARFNEWGTFTQIVWKSATKFGCAIARGQDCAVVNCFYNTGNVAGDQWYSQNVLPAKTSGSTQGQIGEPWSSEPQELAHCPEWAASGYCVAGGQEYLYEDDKGTVKSILEWCPISCPTKRETSKPVKAPKKAGPSDKQCEEWAKKGYCVPSGALFFYQEPQTKETRDIASWCPKACPYTPPDYVPTNVVVARKMMSGKLFVKATADENTATASA